MYATYMSVLGNREDLFGDSPYVDKVADVVVIRDAVGFRVRVAVRVRPCVGFCAVSGFDDDLFGCWATARICSVTLPMWTSTSQILPPTTMSTRNT